MLFTGFHSIPLIKSKGIELLFDGVYMRKTLFLIYVWFFCFSIYSEDIVIYFDSGYSPYSYFEDGQLSGIYVDVMKEAVDQISEYKVVFVPISWKRGLELLEKGKIFALVPPYKRITDRPWMDYTVKILDEELVIVSIVDKELKDRKDWPEDFKDLKIGINSGFASIKESDKKTFKN